MRNASERQDLKNRVESLTAQVEAQDEEFVTGTSAAMRSVVALVQKGALMVQNRFELFGPEQLQQTFREYCNGASSAGEAIRHRCGMADHQGPGRVFDRRTEQVQQVTVLVSLLADPVIGQQQGKDQMDAQQQSSAEREDMDQVQAGCRRVTGQQRGQTVQEAGRRGRVAQLEGTRLRPLTRLRPKVLCPVGDDPLIDHAIGFVRDQLTNWGKKTGHTVRLKAYSSHYNVSFETHGRSVEQTVEKLAYLLAHILPAPVMLVAANRLSTGVGVRPRGNRVEVTVDFTPAPTLSIATAALVTGIARAVMAWPSYELDMLDTMAIPVIRGFRPIPHTSRKGWLAHATSFDASPFEACPDARRWRVSDAYRRLTGDDRAEHSLREVAEVVFRRFLTPIRQIANPFTLRLLMGLMQGHTPALLDLDTRPDAYDDVGRACRWDALFSERQIRRSRYEQVFIHALRGDAEAAVERLARAGGRAIIAHGGFTGAEREKFERICTVAEPPLPTRTTDSAGFPTAALNTSSTR